MNCKSSLLPFNVKGSCKFFLNLHLCFVYMQGLVANSAGPQDVYVAPCKRNYRKNRKVHLSVDRKPRLAELTAVLHITDLLAPSGPV